MCGIIGTDPALLTGREEPVEYTLTLINPLTVVAMELKRLFVILTEFQEIRYLQNPGNMYL